MSDTSPRNPTAASQRIADALLRSVGGTTAQLVLSNSATTSNQSELGLVTTATAEVVLSPVAMRKFRPTWQDSTQNTGQNKWELLVSASSVQQQVQALDLPSAQSLFAMTLSVIVSGQSYILDSAVANEAFGNAYLYRLLLREQRQQAL